MWLITTPIYTNKNKLPTYNIRRLLLIQYVGMIRRYINLLLLISHLGGGLVRICLALAVMLPRTITTAFMGTVGKVTIHGRHVRGTGTT